MKLADLALPIALVTESLSILAIKCAGERLGLVDVDHDQVRANEMLFA
jgi:hypothetical protein